MVFLNVENVSFEYTKGKPIINGLSMEFEKAKVYAIVGKSGSGKTTLLSMLAGLNKPQSGDIKLEGNTILTENMYRFRRNSIGVVFQQFNLLPHLNAIENIELSMDASDKKIVNKRSVIYELLDSVGLTLEEGKKRILKLSGGEQQRVAIARALSYNPDIILADEPTGNLDHETQASIMGILKDLAHNQNKCIIIVTHSFEVTKEADVVYKLTKIY